MMRLITSRRRITGLSWKKLTAALKVDNDEEQQGDTLYQKEGLGTLLSKYIQGRRLKEMEVMQNNFERNVPTLL